jgi:WD40 repeat protein
MSPDGRYALASGVSFRGGQLVETKVFNTSNGQPAGPPLRPGGIIIDAAFSADGRNVATASSAANNPTIRDRIIFEPDGRAGNIQVWDWATGKVLAGPIPLPTEPRGIDYSPDGRQLAVACADGLVLLLEMPGGDLIRRIDTGVRTRPANANFWYSNGQARFTPDGKRLITWEMGNVFHVWDPSTGKKLAELTHGDRVERIFFGSDPDLILTLGRDSYARIWNLSTGHPAAPGLNHSLGAGAALFSLTGEQIFSCGGEGSFNTWNWRTGQLLSTYHLNKEFLFDFAVTPDHRWLVTTGESQTIVSDVRTGSPISPPLFGRNAINLRVNITPDGQRAIVSGFSGELIGYDLESLLSPAQASVEDLVRDAELVSCQRIQDNGEPIQLTPDEWRQRWNSRPKRP